MAYKTPIGKVTILLLPIIIYVKVKEMIADKRAMKALGAVGGVGRGF